MVFQYIGLREFGVAPERIHFNAPGDTNTRLENENFLTLSREQGWTSGVIITQPHQLLRAMLGMINAMEKRSYWMEIYTTAPRFSPWLEVVKGSQGLELKPRVEHIKDEFNKIIEYMGKGDLASFESLGKYLEKRERGSLRLTRHIVS
ncbi:MAG: Uncharacterized protein G01um101493_436 [Microgenomates group bacterium Gr01-1014_93]|nr:MAG: Uncharacterized protein G01um101493_436 [Microgenomates group bacterium Gr01-1014_93]